jgi:hypothetical protein
VVEMLVSDPEGEDVDVSTHYLASPFTQSYDFLDPIYLGVHLKPPV